MQAKPDPSSELVSRITQVVLDVVSNVPGTVEPLNSSAPERARAIANAAALKASAASGTLALPSGPLALLTIAPELVTVWRIQAQMIADIAGAFGRTELLSREQMIYCLFKHSAAQAVRDLVVRIGERYLVRRTTLRAVQVVAAKIGVSVSQRALAEALCRWLPIAGAVGVASYAFYDTRQVAKTAISLFEVDWSPV